MSSRQTILAIVVVGLIILLMPQYMKWISPPPPPVQQQPATEAPVAADTTRAAAQPKTVTEAVAPITSAPVESKPGEISADTVAPEPDYVTVESPLFSMVIGSNAVVSKYDLKKFKLENGAPVDLHHRFSGKDPAVGWMDFDFGSSGIRTISNLRFRANKTRISLNEGGVDSVVFTTGESDGQMIQLVYVINADRYGFELALRTANLKVAETGEYKALWRGGIPFTEPDPSRDLQYGGAYAKVGDDIEKISVASDARKEFNATGQTHFVAARSKYFIAAVVPNTAAAGADIIGKNAAPKVKGTPNFYELTLRETWTGNAAGRWTVYWGPIKLENLKALGVGLEDTMNWGWDIIKPISRFVLWALVGLHSVISNYGVVIVLFSILVKIILWPLTRKSQISMKKMAALQPEMAAIKELHKNNPQAMNAAVMRLYKERGVNPASGCLPLLLQMPVLYSLFVIFSSTIEFRQAGFMLWIKDLSQPDTIAQLGFSIPMYGAHVTVLPIIMGISQFFMSKRTTTDPNQKMMIYIMPVFMLLIFNNLPSGLTLYYTLFNLLAILEQYLIKIPDFPSVSVVEEEMGKKKKFGK
jgi:YidC/Oxa1 family membrane protein insertase